MSARSKQRSRSSKRRRPNARRPLGRPGAVGRPVAGGWRRRHRVRLYHALWLTVAVAFAVEARVVATRFEDEYTALLVFGVTAALWGALGCLIAVFSSPPVNRSERRSRLKLAHLGDRDRPAPPSGPVPWRLPWLAAYGIGMPALVLAGGALAPIDGDETLTLLFAWAFCSLLGWLIGIGLFLFGMLFAYIGAGLVGFGRPALTGRIDGEPVPRAPYVGPFLAIVGLVSLPVSLLGAGAYDSPYRRDVLPLIGVIREGVEVTHPTLLLVSQVASWWFLGLVGIGYIVFRVIGHRARRHQVGESASDRGALF